MDPADPDHLLGVVRTLLQALEVVRLVRLARLELSVVPAHEGRLVLALGVRDAAPGLVLKSDRKRE